MWRRDMAPVANRAHAQAQGLTMDITQMSWAADATGLTTTYAQIHDKALRLLQGAEQNFLAIADALETAANSYESSDEAAAAGITRATK